MTTDTLMFDLLAKDSASGAFRDLARSATVAAGEMHAAFADPVEAKIKTEGFDEYMAKLAEVKAANDLSIGDIQAKTMKLVEGADQAGRELDAMAQHLDNAGNSAERNRGKFSSLLSTLGGLGKGAGALSGGGMLAGIGGAGAAGLMVGIGGLASALTSAAGAGGILGLAIGGDVKGYMALKQQIDTVSKSLSSATPGTATYTAKQKELATLQKQMSQQYGPLVEGIGKMSTAWHGFLDKTKGPVMHLMGEGLKIVADALKGFAPVAKAAAKALEPLLHQLDAWVKSSGFKDMMKWLATSGTQALADFAHFVGEAVKGFIDLMEKLAPIGSKIADFLGHLGSTGALATLGVVLGGIAAALTGISGPVAAVVAGLVAIGGAMIYAWQHSAKFRQIATQAFHRVLGAVRSLVTAAKGFWHQWGDTIKKFGLATLETFVKQAGHALSGLMHLVAAILDALSGNWKGAWRNIKQFALDEMKGLIAPFSGILHAIGSLFSAAWHGIQSVASAFWHWFTSGWSTLWHRTESQVSSGISAVVHFFQGLPGKITGALSGLAGALFQIGVHAMQGLLNGLESMAGAVAAKVSSIASSIPGKLAGVLGIHSPSRVMHQQGQHVMDGLINGLKSREAKLTAQVGHIANLIKAAMSFDQAFAGNVFSAGLATTKTVTVPGQVHREVINGQTVITSTPATTKTVGMSNAQILHEMFAYQRGQVHQDRTLARNVAKLKREGLSQSLIAQMESAGTEGLAEIAALASGSKSQVRQFNRLNAQANTALQNAGAQAVAGKSMSHLRRQKAQEETIARGVKKALHHVEFKLHHPHKLRVTG